MDELRPAAEILRVAGMSAGYRGRPVVAAIDLALQRGDILGLLGANGAGKSTFLKAITGQIKMLEGGVTIDGADLARQAVRAKAAFGLAIDASDLPAALSGQQYLELVASVRACAADAWSCGNVPERLGLVQWLNRPIAQYSLGTRAKISIAAALLGAPPLLIFDESLNGLDPVAAWECKRIIAEFAATGRHAVIVSTHVVETVPALCNRAVFLADGHIVESWDRDGLLAANHAPGAFEACVMQALNAHAARSMAVM